MTFIEWWEYHPIQCGHTLTEVAMRAWDTAYEEGFNAGYEEHMNDSEGPISELNQLAFKLYIALGTVCHDYQVELSKEDREMVKAALHAFREYKDY